jgi:hypothetical protein
MLADIATGYMQKPCGAASKAYLMCLDMCSEAYSQLLRRIEHQLTIASHNRSVDDNGRCLDILELATEEVMFESCVRG